METQHCPRGTRAGQGGWRGMLVAVSAMMLLTLLAACGGGGIATTATTGASTTRVVSLPPSFGAVDAATTATSEPTATRPVVTQPAAAVTPTSLPSSVGQVASPPAQPTPIPPRAPAIGATVAGQGWEITVTDVTTYGRVGAFRAEGVFVYVTLTIRNTGSTAAAFPYDGLLVVDVNGATFNLAVGATKETLTYDKGIDFFAQIEPGASANVAAVFDTAVDATGLKLTTPSRVFTIILSYLESPK